jgi:SAM-dependent methyltransferase
MAAALAGILMYVGDRAGLFKTLAARGPMTAAELARAASLQERYVREWLSVMAGRQIVEYDAAADRFSLPAEHAHVLADEESPLFSAGWFAALPAAYRTAPALLRAFREGGGVPFAEFGPEWVEGFGRSRRAIFRHYLVQHWIPLMPGMRERLEAGITVADIGCGPGQATIVLARAFPRSRVVGFDADEGSLRLAAANAAAAAVADRVEFRRRALDDLDARDAFDLVLLFDCVHDLAEPVRSLRNVRAALRRGGRVLIQELNAGESLSDNLTPFGAYIYTVSTVHCLTASLARTGAGLGAAMPPSTLRRLLTEAGFASIVRLPFEHPLYSLYEARL